MLQVPICSLHTPQLILNMRGGDPERQLQMMRINGSLFSFCRSPSAALEEGLGRLLFLIYFCMGALKPKGTFTGYTSSPGLAYETHRERSVKFSPQQRHKELVRILRGHNAP